MFLLPGEEPEENRAGTGPAAGEVVNPPRGQEPGTRAGQVSRYRSVNASRHDTPQCDEGELLL